MSPSPFAAVIPLHQKRATVAAAIRSVLAQTLPAAEILVVDDASTDGGAEVVATFADPRIRLLRRDEPGPGGYAARNLAAERARSEWIAFLDADDVWRPDHLEVLAGAARAHPGVGCVATRYAHVFADRTEPDAVARRLAGPEGAVTRLDLPAFLQCWLEARACPMWTGAVAVRRDVLLAAGGFPAGRAERGGDKDLWLRAVRMAGLAFASRATADFSRDAPGKLTDRVDTRTLPCLVGTARAMAATAGDRERALLGRLINQEIELYARWTARTGGRPALKLGDLARPASPAAVATLLAARRLPRPLLRAAYRWEHRRRARRRATAGAPRATVAVIGLRGVPGVIGGIETHCELLYPALAEAAPDLSFQLLARRPYAPARDYALGGARVRALASPKRRGAEALVHSLWAVVYARIRLRAAVAHLHGIGPAFFAPLARALGMRVVVTHHAADFERPKWGRAARTFLRGGEGAAARFADAVICVSRAVRDDFLGRHARAAPRTTVIRHAVRLAEPSPELEGAVLGGLGLRRGGYLLTVGRLDETKRIDDLIRAHAAVGPGAPALVIVGGSVDEDDHERALRAMAGPGVVFAGRRGGDELAALYRGSALFLHASGMEGFGLVVLEAMAAGLPVALSDIPAHREFGLSEACYFPVGDEAAIARHMRGASGERPRRPDHRAAVAGHDLHRAVSAHLAVFRDLIGSRERGSGRTSANIPPRPCPR